MSPGLGKEALNTDTKEPFDVTHLAQAIELDKLLFKLFKVFLVIRMCHGLGKGGMIGAGSR
jgi:hypothetical protein